MTATAAPLSREDAPPLRLGALIARLDTVYLYVVVLTASTAIYRYGDTYLWYAIYAWTLARLALEPQAALRAVVRDWAVFIWPALAVASVLWSMAPETTLRGGLQLLITTLIGVFIGHRFPVKDILVAITAVFFCATVASLALLFAGAPDLFEQSGGFQGVFPHKNTMGLRMNILIAAALMLAIAARPRALYAAVALVGVYALALSKSATSQILALATPFILIAMSILKLPTRVASMFAVGGFACLAAGAATLFIFNGDPVTFVLDAFGKDATLTKRTWLWERAVEQIANHPIIGGGYQAFWSNERSSDVLWIRNVTLDSVSGFHNVALEVWNDLGIAGLVSLFVVLLMYALRTFRFSLASPSIYSFFPLFFLLVALVSGAVNNSFYRQHELAHVLLCAFYAAAVLPPRADPKRGAP